MASPAKRPRLSGDAIADHAALPDLDGPTVEVLVQDYRLPDATSFHCHVSVLCQSPWFKKALDPEAAGEDRPVKTIDLSEHCNDPEVFKLYQSFYVLVKAYLLGEKFSDQAFKQAIFDRFLTDYENLPSLSAQVDTLSLLRLIRYHNEISLSSRLCKLVMDLFITKTPALSKDDLAYVPDDLKNFIIEAFFAKRDSQGNLDTLT